ncbi:hypothetical protein LMG27174_05438 [Paraburkholderia rhynchosiae]|uniref:Sugar transporter n=1 Tax=Paraburkholderia rhynchosiae TaxID=487049 RepID=A0A6J5C710_9BURK|nr:hypothetical protein LMG27174_05438 [Paraburkholderia rhynchosiae]
MRRFHLLALTAMVPALLAGCATSPSPTLYTLTAVEGAAQEQKSVRPGAIEIAMGAVTVPELVDRRRPKA